MYFFKTPSIIQSLFRGLIWRISNSKKLYLTFDDGPIPEATPWILDLLKKEEIKATFFCVGENVKKYPDIYQRIINEGHSIGNHTFNHLNAWKVDDQNYLSNIKEASLVLDTKLFRPPYGKLSPSLYRKLKKDYHIIMWDVLSGDFDTSLSPEACLQNVEKNAKEGSIVVFHDSIKAIETVKIVLPKVISFYKDKGIEMDKIKMT